MFNRKRKKAERRPPLQVSAEQRAYAENAGLNYIPRTAVAKMMRDYYTSHREVVDQFFWDDPEANREALALMRKGMRGRYDPQMLEGMLMSMSTHSAAKIRHFMDWNLRGVPPSEYNDPQPVGASAARRFMGPGRVGSQPKPKGAGWKAKNPTYREFLSEVFGDEDRLYFEVPTPIGVVETRVAQALANKGYTLTDYKGGYAKDNETGATFKIGRLLNKWGFDELLTEFSQDGLRSDEDVMVVISRHPYDIGRMSTGREWNSCASLYWTQINVNDWWHQAGNLVGKGLVAYMVRKTDPDIHNPLARTTLKPYGNSDKDGDGPIYYRDATYGRNQRLLDNAVDYFAETYLNHDKFGWFGTVDGVTYEYPTGLVRTENGVKQEYLYTQQAKHGADLTYY